MQVAGKLTPHLLIDVLGTSLEAMSSLEAPALQYLQLHSNAGSTGLSVSPEQLESIRISATKDTHMGKIVDRCLNQLRDSTIAELEAVLPTGATAGGAIDVKDVDVDMGASAASKAKDVTYLGAIITKLSDLVR